MRLTVHQPRETVGFLRVFVYSKQNASHIIMQRAGNWRAEADAVIRDIDKHVKTIKLSPTLESSAQCVFLNLTTMENKSFCVELSGNGFRVVGKAHDTLNAPGEPYFETPYSLLSSISPLYNDSFGQELMKKLTKLADKYR